MRKILFSVIMMAGISAMAKPNTYTCKLEDSDYWQKGTVIEVVVSSDLKDATLLTKKGGFEYELGSMEPVLTFVSSAKVNKDWETATYTSSNYDDTNFMIILTTDADRSRMRLAIHVLVDGLDGGTRAHGLECY